MMAVTPGELRFYEFELGQIKEMEDAVDVFLRNKFSIGVRLEDESNHPAWVGYPFEVPPHLSEYWEEPYMRNEVLRRFSAVGWRVTLGQNNVVSFRLKHHREQ